ncbi:MULTISPECIES: ABC transporter substrate-binding protein [unclassified Streptomyces]|uniref:ABC transporter substrate-binding protein n=1 Tax=unclassified Streptomyces TaxID=2593676 RepID=UPI002DDA974F|nr:MULTISPECIES: ABC transporter substrate-binding protein [unclassified Streptomyces]WSA90849.1 ABC transporter substrate-binding protein [Streptomyces sp. NBC_01795]WSB75171.1 ABC transporter substrate-binding protein [Streptomyces sp. NBC_01775]WSS16546.1 ABC transporter substrate-binding protein [Streptomyces sp. NBC_01186]WSS45363.1 ABC transporter substrate-binding protein [Streptomyces sp. NBC_01187]
MAEKDGTPPTRSRSAPPQPPPSPPQLWRRRSLLGASLGAGAALALSGCGGRATTAAAGETSTLKWGWDLPTSWDPVTSSAGWDVHGLSLVYAGLTKLDQEGKAVPALASSWSYSHGGTVVRFRLRPGLRFSDGARLDAEAVVKSLKRGRDHPKSLVAAQLVGVKTIAAPDPRTVELRLSEPDYQVPALLAGKTGMIVNPAALKKDPGALATQPAGAGPYTLTSYVQNSRAILRSNPRYWDARHIKVDNFELYPLPEGSTVVASLTSGQYNVAQIPGSQVKAARAAGLQVQVIPSMVVAVLDVHTGKKPFDDPDVALALKYAVDREQLLKTALFGHGEVTRQPFPDGYAGHDKALDRLFPYDPAKARKLLAKAGHAKGLEITLTTQQAEGVPELLQAQLKRVGIDVKIETIPAAQATQIVYVQRAKALYVDQFAGRESATQGFQVLFGKEGLMNPGRQVSPKLEKALDAVRRTPLEAPHYPKVLREASGIAVREMPNVFLYTIPRILARNAQVSEIPAHPVVQRFEGVTVS